MNATDEMVSMSLRLVDPGSLRNAAVTRAADAVERVMTSGRAQKLNLGWTPHVLSMPIRDWEDDLGSLRVINYEGIYSVKGPKWFAWPKT